MKPRLLFIQYGGFVAIGLGSGILGPLLPAIAADLAIGYGQAGILLAVQFLGSLTAELIGGPLADRFGKRPFLLAGGLFILTGAGGCALAGDFRLLLFWNAVLGAGLAIYNVGINALCADSASAAKGKALNYLHFFFGAGSILGPLLTAFCLNVFQSWRATFALVTLLPLLISFALPGLRLEEKQRPAGAKKEISPYRDSFLWAAGLFSFVYVGLEVSISGWITAFWSKIALHGAFPAQLPVGVFWAALTFGRLCCGRLVDRVSFSRYIIAASAVALFFGFCWYVWPGGNLSDADGRADRQLPRQHRQGGRLGHRLRRFGRLPDHPRRGPIGRLVRLRRIPCRDAGNRRRTDGDRLSDLGHHLQIPFHPRCGGLGSLSFWPE